MSDAIRAVLRHADLAGRVGGDELLLVLPNTGAEGAMQLANGCGLLWPPALCDLEGTVRSPCT